MGFFSSSIADSANAIGNAVDKVFTSDEERLNAKNVTMKLLQESDVLQVELNRLAAKKSFFYSGWRPSAAWVCVLCMVLNNLAFPICHAITGLPMPQLGMAANMDLLGALLGLAAYRSYDKKIGTAS